MRIINNYWHKERPIIICYVSSPVELHPPKKKEKKREKKESVLRSKGASKDDVCVVRGRLLRFTVRCHSSAVGEALVLGVSAFGYI